MKKWVTLFILVFAVQSFAQYSSYLYIVTPGQAEKNQWRSKYETAYAVRAMQPFGEDGLEQRLGGIYGLSDRLNLSAVAATILEGDDQSTLVSGHIEIMYDIKQVSEQGLSLSLGGAWLREFQHVQTLQTRLASSWKQENWGLAANFVLQKPFDENRDAVDVLFSMGSNVRVNKHVRFGIELIGEDLEGFFEEEEAEGGAKMLLTPVLTVTAIKDLRMCLGAGPIYYLTQSTKSSTAPRVLPTMPDRNGWMVRLSAVYNM